VYSSSQRCHTATGTHMPHEITQCYLPPGRGDIRALNPAEAGTRLSDPGRMQGWVDLIDCRIGVVNKLDRRRRRVLLTTRSTCRGKIFCVQSLGQSTTRRYPYFRGTRNFLITQFNVGERKLPCQKLALSDRSFQYNTGLWQTDRRTDGHTTTAITAPAQRRAVKKS